MPPEKRRHESVGQWLRHAQSDLSLATQPLPPHALLEHLCFHAQQAAEKALKAVLVSHEIAPSRTHSLQVLCSLLPVSVPRPDFFNRVLINTLQNPRMDFSACRGKKPPAKALFCEGFAGAKQVEKVQDGLSQHPVKELAGLNVFAVLARYPEFDETVTDARYRQVVALAEKTLTWAENHLEPYLTGNSL